MITAHLRNAKNAEAAAEIALELGAVKAAYESGTPINFADKYISLIYPEHVCLLDYFKDKGFKQINTATLSNSEYIIRLDKGLATKKESKEKIPLEDFIKII